MPKHLGKYQDQAGQSSCKLCDQGRYGNSTGLVYPKIQFAVLTVTVSAPSSDEYKIAGEYRLEPFKKHEDKSCQIIKKLVFLQTNSFVFEKSLKKCTREPNSRVFGREAAENSTVWREACTF